jgi:light-harvesting protein B-800-850 alpha chain
MEFKDKNHGIWLMVKPTIGIPLFFLAIMITSLLIHVAVLTHSTWYPAYFQGHPRSFSSSAQPSHTPDLVALA